MKHVVIIGNGISGITAARHIRKRSGFRITVISSETEHFFSRTALMYLYMGHMTFENLKPYEDWFWKKNRIDLVYDTVVRVDSGSRNLHLKSGKNIPYDTLILACGSKSNFFGWPGEDAAGVQALYSYQDLQKMEKSTRGVTDAVVIGGGLIGVELAEMLCSRKINVTIILREAAFWSNALPIQEATMISRHIESHGVRLLHGRQIQRISSDEGGRVTGVTTDKGEQVPAQFVGIAVGVRPNIEWLHGSGVDVKHGILVNEYLETNIPDIYAIGDCVERQYALPGRKSIEQVWYTARMMGEVVAQTVCGERTPYAPGPWFNSAKFFDIEFQTYGLVRNSLEEDEDDLYWEHPSGRKAIHMVWNKSSGEFSGINAFGIRLRHEKFDSWLRTKKDISYVLEHLDEANFDPEFSERHEADIRRAFQRKPRNDEQQIAAKE